MQQRTTTELRKIDKAYLWHPFTQMQEWLETEPLIIVEAEGNYLIDSDGNRYLDGVASLWCNVHGHRNPVIDRAIRDQLDRVAHSTLLGLASSPSALLAERLVSITPAGLTRVFYSDAGATAVEIALKMALQYWQLRGKREKRSFVALEEGYHGDTLGAISVGYSSVFHRFFPPLLKVYRLRPPCKIARSLGPGVSSADVVRQAIEEFEQTLEAHGEQIAALVMEPVMQGAAGMWPQPIEYLPAMAELAKRHQVLLICDEVATGFGRTGRMFACDHTSTSPDLLCLGKGLTGGYLPLAATLASDEIFSAFLGRYEDYTAFFHGHTFTGNALACSAALASLDLFSRNRILEVLPKKVAKLSSKLAELIAPLPLVAEVRQRGLMVGIELGQPGKSGHTAFEPSQRVGHRVCMGARNEALIIRPLGDVVVLMPPLSITDDQIDHLVSATAQAIQAVSTSLGS